MSVNDKVKVIWKTNCQRKDHPHFPKRKEIKLGNCDGEENSYVSLKYGDKLKLNLDPAGMMLRWPRNGIPNLKKVGAIL